MAVELIHRSPPLQVRRLGLRDYVPVWRDMQEFTKSRTSETLDQIWLLQHTPVFTLGLAGNPSHLLDPGTIPVVRVERGGQATYHGPGQLVAYVLLDLRRRHLGVRRLVSALEDAVLKLLASYGIPGKTRPRAPGVYVAERKIAALGLRVCQRGSFHGLSLNVAMDLEPFKRINPCGHPGLEVTQLADFGISDDVNRVADLLLPHLLDTLTGEYASPSAASPGRA